MSATFAVSPLSDLTRVLHAARQTTADRTLSVYLDTSPERTIGRGYLVAFRTECRAMRSHLDEADRDEVRRFDVAVGNVDAYLAGQTSPSAPGLAIFATGEADDVLATPLPFRPVDRVSWTERPIIEPLAEALDESERIVALLVDKERGRFFTIVLGQIEARQELVDEVPGKQATGDWFALSQKRYARHHEDHVLRHVKRTIRALSDELRARPFDRLFVGGPDEAVSLLVHHLPRPLSGRLAGTLSLELFASDAEILAAALAAAEAAERRDEVKAIEELLSDATTPHVAVGLESTLAALTIGRVHRLFVAADLARDGARCETCGRLTAYPGLCPVCAGPTRPIADLREQAIELALAQGARVEIVHGLAAALLRERGGLGARTRY